MKQLLLIRHANALHESTGGDFGRQLSPKGIAEAEEMAAMAVSKGLVPHLIVSSEAVRAKSTAAVFCKYFNLVAPQTSPVIYEGGEKKLLKLLNNFPADQDYIALVGHNPDISNFLYLLTGEIREVPTCTVALITFETDDWAHISSETGTLKWYGTPTIN